MRRTLCWLLSPIASLIAVIAAAETWKHLDRPGHAAVEGALAAGQRFRQAFSPGFFLELNPIDHGWQIDVREGSDPRSLTAYTTPLHFVPNACCLEGWHLRNADNTGPNASGPKDVNAPGLVREFAFLPAAQITPNLKETVRRAAAFGKGHLELLEHELVDLAQGARASFASIRFRVILDWPPSYLRSP